MSNFLDIFLGVFVALAGNAFILISANQMIWGA